ncbi:MAG TPA: hypothetical protein DD412_04190 [Holosporales bacterium]|nr:hypothetical protein [Holosporales bacterium]
MKNFIVLACLLSMSMPVLGSALSDSETIEEAYDIPVTIGIKGIMASIECNTSAVMLCYPDGKEVAVFERLEEKNLKILAFVCLIYLLRI